MVKTKKKEQNIQGDKYEKVQSKNNGRSSGQLPIPL